MTSVLKEIRKLRKNAKFLVDRKNSNRYRIVAVESNGSRTAYCFAVPIYNIKSQKTVDMKFYAKDETTYVTGSNASITIDENIRLENAEGSCVISLFEHPDRVSDHEASCSKIQIYPTTNGISIKSEIIEGRPYTFSIEVSKSFLEVRDNDRFFALMSEMFKPFIAVSCIGTLDSSGKIISPAKLSYKKGSDHKYVISILPCSSLGQSVLLETNLYEPKLFQDTTVESNNPQINNAFGSVGFIGTTQEYGEQWLYTRPDFSKLSELEDKKILRAVLHLPKLNNSAIELTASKVAARFCSFGSTWDTKIAETAMHVDSQITDEYIDVDLTTMLSDEHGKLVKDEGFILRPKNKGEGFSAIATGDNYLYPQILEINYV